MSNQVEDVDFDRLIADKQHAEFMRAMKNLMVTLDKLNQAPQLERSLTQIVDRLSNLSLSVKSPDVTVQTNQKEVIDAIQKMTTELSKSIQTLVEPKEEKQDSWQFTVNRNQHGFIQSVTANKK